MILARALSGQRVTRWFNQYLQNGATLKVRLRPRIPLDLAVSVPLRIQPNPYYGTHVCPGDRFLHDPNESFKERF